MHNSIRALAAIVLVLLSPAALFMTALVMRYLGPLEYEPAHMAQQIVTWYSIRPWTLWVLLIGLPLIVLITGCVTLLSDRNEDRESLLATGDPTVPYRGRSAHHIMAAASLAAGVILAVVGVHMLAN
ncbi:MAG: hypothetical protein EPO31_10720 [Gammaproteobacteria bacterium]|nr:MAG: hypothetical protein EPO31_10720 [Gammaproteobacteria bacterium]